MKTLLVPTFKAVWPIGRKHLTYQFCGHAEIKIKNKPDSSDYQKVTNKLPGLTCGYCEDLYNIVKTGNPIQITRFYDIRQRGVNKLKNYYITLKN